MNAGCGVRGNQFVFGYLCVEIFLHFFAPTNSHLILSTISSQKVDHSARLVVCRGPINDDLLESRPPLPASADPRYPPVSYVPMCHVSYVPQYAYRRGECKGRDSAALIFSLLFRALFSSHHLSYPTNMVAVWKEVKLINIWMGWFNGTFFRVSSTLAKLRLLFNLNKRHFKPKEEEGVLRPSFFLLFRALFSSHLSSQLYLSIHPPPPLNAFLPLSSRIIPCLPSRSMFPNCAIFQSAQWGMISVWYPLPFFIYHILIRRISPSAHLQT